MVLDGVKCYQVKGFVQVEASANDGFCLGVDDRLKNKLRHVHQFSKDFELA